MLYVAYININIKASIAQILFQAKTNTTGEKANYQLCFDLRGSRMADFLPKEILAKVSDPSILFYPMAILDQTDGVFMYV